MNEELLQEIKSTLPWLLVAALAVGGYYGVKNYRASKKAAASQAVSGTYTTDEVEEAVSKFGGSDAGGVLKIRLAKKYYDDARYEEALSQYDDVAKDAPDGFADIAVVGRAQCLEALQKYDDALAAYSGFTEANPKSCLALTARLGALRVTALKGDSAKALEGLKSLKDEVKDDEMAKLRVEKAEDVVKRLAK